MVTIQELSSQRVPLLTSVTCTTENTPPIILSMLDLSEGGVFIQTSYPLPLGTQITCSFNMGDNPEPINVITEVAWTRPGPPNMEPPPGMGLKFLNLSANQLIRIRSVIEKHTEYAKYYEKFGRIPEDAMALSPPKLSLIANNQELETELKSLSATNLLATVALPFFKIGQKINATVPSENIDEQGTISWLKFTVDNQNGIPELQMGIELSLNSWGEEKAKRLTKPMINVRQVNQTELEIINEIPASITIAPTLPLKEDDSSPVAATNTTLEYQQPTIQQSSITNPQTNNKQSKPKQIPLPIPPETPDIIVSNPMLRNTLAIPQNNNHTASNPIHTNNKISNDIAIPSISNDNKATNNDFVNTPNNTSFPNISTELKFPSPIFKSDTHPITGATSGWPLTTKATIFLVLGIFLMLGIVGSFLNESKLNTIKSVNHNSNNKEIATMEEFIQPQHTIPFTKGTGKTIIIPQKNLASINQTSAKNKKQEETKNILNTKNTSTKIKVKPFSFRKIANKKILNFGVNNTEFKATYYELASPYGIVINIKNGKLLKENGYLKIQNRSIRKIKIIKMSFGSRAIIYTKRKPHNIKLSKSKYQIKLNFI